MKNFLWVTAVVLAALPQCAYANSIPSFNIAQVTIFVGINGGSGDNIFFALTGPGTNISGDSGAGCFDWCSFNNFSPGDVPPLGIGEMAVSLFHTAMIGGNTYDPDSEIGFNSSFSLNVLGSFLFPANPNSSTFTACVPASMTSPLTGLAGSGETFTHFQLNLPAGGNFCTSWNFDAVSGHYQFSQGKFVVSTIPEPATISLMVTGVIGMLIRRKLLARDSSN